MSFSYLFIAAFLSSVLIRILKKPSLRAGYVDNALYCPQGRKKHIRPTAPIGGLIAIPVAMIISAMAGFDWIAHWPLALAIIISLIMGAIDDIAHLSSLKKLGVQVLIAFILVGPGGAEIHNLGNLLGTGNIDLGVASFLFSLFCMILLINAINMIDGLDGLLGGIGLILLGFMGLFCAIGFDSAYFTLIFPFMGAILGFYLMNMRFPWQRQAHVFFGDAGSLSLGCVIGWLAITLYNDPDLSLPSMALGWLLAFPVMDAFALFTLRLSERRSPFDGDRYHFHHILSDSGFSDTTSVLILHAIHFLYAIIALIIYLSGGAFEFVFFYLWLTLLITHTIIAFKAHWAEKKIHDIFSLK